MTPALPILAMDYETFSRCNLLTDGAYNYAKDPSTGIHFLSWTWMDPATLLPLQAEPSLWNAHRTGPPLCLTVQGKPVEVPPGLPFPEELAAHFELSHDASIWCHNAQFERLVSWFVLCPDFDVPEPRLEAFYCTANLARARALPAKLDNLCRAVGLPVDKQKDREGKQLIRELCIPQADGEFHWPAARMSQFAEYCRQDVTAEVFAARKVITDFGGDLDIEDLEQFWISERINDRGITVDMATAKAAQSYAEAEQEELTRELVELTKGAVTTPRQFARAKDWLLPRLSEDLANLLKVYKKGEKKVSLDAHRRKLLLDQEELEPGCLSWEVFDFVNCLDEAGKTSVHKFKAMQSRADPEDNRVRGAYIANGALQTGRYSSVGLQVHNFVRDVAEDPDQIARILAENEPLERVMHTLASMLRPTLIAPQGHSLVTGDLASIEACALPWLADDRRAAGRLKTFREGGDIYVSTANRLFPGKGEEYRQTGKVTELSMGYGGAVGALLAMARTYGVVISETEAIPIVKGWRRDNRWCVDFWYATSAAVAGAYMNPGAWVPSGKLHYYFHDQGIGQVKVMRYSKNLEKRTTKPVEHDTWVDTKYGLLVCRLPSGRLLYYPRMAIAPFYRWDPERQLETKSNAVASSLKGTWTPAADEPEADWPRVLLWHGLLVENATQATCADILRECLARIDSGAKDWSPVVLHTHDEIVLECLTESGALAAARLKVEMEKRCHWTDDEFPLRAEVYVSSRYGVKAKPETTKETTDQ